MKTKKPPKYKFYTREDYAIRRIDAHLAKRIGLNESIVLMQIDYLINMESNDKYYDGSYWTYDSLEDFTTKYFNFWSPSTVKRILTSLMKDNLIKKGNYNKAKFDKTVWYTINYAEASKLNEILVGYTDEKGVTQPLGQYDLTRRSDWSDEKVNLTPPIPKSSTKSSTKKKSDQSETHENKINTEQDTENQKKKTDNEISDAKPNTEIFPTKPDTEISDAESSTDALHENTELSRTDFLLSLIFDTETNTEISDTEINTEFKDRIIAHINTEGFASGAAVSKVLDEMTDRELKAFYDLLSDAESNMLHSKYWSRLANMADMDEPPSINRNLLRKKHTVSMSKELFYKFDDFKKDGFGGKSDIIEGYVAHELALWDFKKSRINKESATLRFQKEIYLGHPIAKHYVNMTPAQRQMERELYSK